MWLLYLTSIIPVPVLSIPVWLFTPKSKTQFSANCKALINYQLNILFYLFLSVLLIPLLIGVILVIALLTYHLRFIFNSLKSNSTGSLPFSFTFIN
ncbi:DUF4870 domain-containing protein [Ignavibacterium sp.]|uniref:DUF4870 domain-containing protein n=1 Tax=Ignavibacterium TaxID=795750 RepID=UPI0025C1EFB6|nr:DUF4870 domain-containing protein [Ignavibacterium sp.]